MNSDSSFYIGTSHEKCEDYTSHQDNLILVSDGCSSAQKTDIGARIICESAKQHKAYQFKKGLLMPFCSRIIKMIGLPDECLYATLLTAYIENNQILIEAIGDGNIIIKTKDGILHILSMSYSKSAPYYMGYLIDKNNDFLWVSMENNNFIITYTKIDLEDNIFHKIRSTKDYRFNADTFVCNNSSFDFSPRKNSITLPVENVEWVALSSDGLNSFYKRDIEVDGINSYYQPVEHISVIKELMKINNTNGRFVQRRVNRFRKRCNDLNWHNEDDVSLAVLVP